LSNLYVAVTDRLHRHRAAVGAGGAIGLFEDMTPAGDGPLGNEAVTGPKDLIELAWQDKRLGLGSHGREPTASSQSVGRHQRWTALRREGDRRGNGQRPYWCFVTQIVVRSNGPLEGTVRVGGAKNSALKLMAATLLAEGEYRLRNVPAITDVETMTELLTFMGLAVSRSGHDELVVRRGTDCGTEAPYELVERMRASIVVLGPLLGRVGHARVAMPGGDDFGSRPIDMHLGGLEQMGATFQIQHGYIEATADHLLGARIVLEFPSVGATENLLLAAVLAKGTTVIENAAREPEIADLAAFLNRMGAVIIGAGSSTIRIEGAEELSPVDHTVIPDRIEAATYLAAVALAGGEIGLDGARPDHMDMFIKKLGDMGVRVAPTSGGVWAASRSRLHSVDVSTLPYPGIATDYKPLFVAMLSVADGVAIVTENLFAGRFKYVSELIRMGADIRTEGHHAVVRGRTRLSGAPVRASDIRAGAALVVAGLGADGETVVADAHHVDRGYEDLPAGLRALGGDVTRVR
jgi:UDP-N-acetylglucosamine 1-carboxyvinyltransferase